MIKKWTKGRLIVDLEDLYNQEFIIMYGKVYNKGWFQNWLMVWAKHHIQQQVIYKAVRID